MPGKIYAIAVILILMIILIVGGLLYVFFVQQRIVDTIEKMNENAKDIAEIAAFENASGLTIRRYQSKTDSRSMYVLVDPSNMIMVNKDEDLSVAVKNNWRDLIVSYNNNEITSYVQKN